MPDPVPLSRRLLGAALLGAAYLPLHRLLDPSVTGLAGRATRRIAEDTWQAGMWGTLIAVGLAVVLALLLPRDPLGPARRVASALAEIPAGGFAGLCAGVAFAGAALVAWRILGFLPASVDEMVALLHARVLASGRLALPLPADPAGWIVQNSVITPRGWASVYPPFHLGVLALGLLVGAPWVVGPAATAVTAGVGFLVLARLFPGRPALTRGLGLLVALAPFGIFLGGTFLSHTTAGALAVLVAWTVLRSRDGSAAWSVATGACVGAFVCTRPWTGMALSSVMLGAAWLPRIATRKGAVAWATRRGLGLLVGGLPFAALLFSWNQLLFGGPLTLGYTAAFGPAHGLGLHPDPWGNVYGPVQALAYTGADLSQLGAHLLEGPLPAVAVVGAALVVVRRLPPGTPLLLAWALAGVLANAAYWHHGILMGPRMLYETGPAWVGLWGVAIVEMAGRASPLPSMGRRVVAWAGIVSLAAAPFLVLSRARSYSPHASAREAASVPALPDPAVVFVHGSWSSRVAARLVALGMRRDSVETALRRNGLCDVDRYARWRAGDRASPPPPLALSPQPGMPEGLVLRSISPGNRARFRAGAALDGPCMRQARADREGTEELEPLLWQAPPLPEAPVVVVRDMGPGEDEAIRSAFPSRSAWIAVYGGGGAPPRIMEYRAGLAELWGTGDPGPGNPAP
jgi:hypothetical protein